VTVPIRREMRRRAAVEPVIGHAKAEHRMGRNYLKGRNGDRINAVLAAAGYNFNILLRWLARLLRGLVRLLLGAPLVRIALITSLVPLLHGRLGAANDTDRKPAFQTAWPKPSSKSSSGIMRESTTGPTPPACSNLISGSSITTPCFRARRWATARRASSGSRWREKTTETAVGAVRRPHAGAKSTEAIGSSPQPVRRGDATHLA
jgi:hypothetical protein